MKFIYLHGFNSAGFGSKVNYLRNGFGDENIINLNYPYNPKKAIKLFEYLVDKLKEDDLFLIGSSQGGFFSLYLAFKYKVKAILINPQVKTLNIQLDKIIILENFKTGEKYEYKKEYNDFLKTLELSEDQIREISHLLYAYLDADDEVIHGKKTADYLEKLGVYVKLFPGGTHYFEHLPELIEDLKKNVIKNNF